MSESNSVDFRNMGPDDVREGLLRFTHEAVGLPAYIQQLEDQYNEAAAAYQDKFDGIYLRAEGSIDDRKARARLECRDERAARDLASTMLKASQTRLSLLKSSQVAAAAVLKDMNREIRYG